MLKFTLNKRGSVPINECPKETHVFKFYIIVTVLMTVNAVGIVVVALLGQNKNHALKKEIGKVDNQNAELISVAEREISANRNIQRQLERRLINFDAELKHLQKTHSFNCSNATTHCRSPNVTKTETIYFSAYSTHNRQYNDQQVMLFDGVMSNVGSAFDAKNSVFICPISGHYLFFINLFTDADHHCRASLYLESAQRFAQADSPKSDTPDNGSAMAIAFCAKGKRVWVKNNGGGILWGGSIRRSVFTGVLLGSVTE